MAEPQSKLEITPQVIDLGEKIIQLHHVVSAGRTAVHPFRLVGFGLIAIGLALLGIELGLKGATAFVLTGGGSLPLWLGFVAAGIGLFLSLYARRQLIIRTVDGVSTVLPAESDEAGAAIVLKIRQAMETAATASRGAASPVALHTGPASHATPLSASPAPALGIGDLSTPRTAQPLGLPPAQQAVTRAAPSAETTTPHTVPTGRRIEPYVNGHAARGATGAPPAIGPEPAGHEPNPLAQRRQMTSPAHAFQGTNEANRHPGPGPGGLGPAEPATPHAIHPQVQASQGSHAPQGNQAAQSQAREPLALPSTLPAGMLAAAAARDDGGRDLALLVEHVKNANVQHKDALLDLLRVIEDHYRGRASREDAVAHWRSFADYVVQYLGEVDGLIAHTERFGRHMLPR